MSQNNLADLAWIHIDSTEDIRKDRSIDNMESTEEVRRDRSIGNMKGQIYW